MEENNVIEKVEGEVVDKATPIDTVATSVDYKPRRFASVRFYLNDSVVYRFDLWTSDNGHGSYMTDDDGNKLIQLKNIINNFNDIRPEKPNQVKDFFAIVGLIRFMFPKTMFPIKASDKEEAVIVTLENEITNNIKMAKLKGFRVEINPESD